MKFIVFLLIMCWMVSCKNPADSYVKTFEMVDIPKTMVPDTAVVDRYLQIRARAQADNSCWYNLYFELKKTKDFEYTLKAYGTFESFGVCHDKEVVRDTVINFLPTKQGTYHFLISRVPGKTEVDSMVVVE